MLGMLGMKRWCGAVVSTHIRERRPKSGSQTVVVWVAGFTFGTHLTYDFALRLCKERFSSSLSSPSYSSIPGIFQGPAIIAPIIITTGMMELQLLLMGFTVQDGRGHGGPVPPCGQDSL